MVNNNGTKMIFVYKKLIFYSYIFVTSVSNKTPIMEPVVMRKELMNYDTIALLCNHLILDYDDPIIKEYREKTFAERRKYKYILPIPTLRHHWLRVLAQTCRWFKRCVYKYRRDTTQPTFDHKDQSRALYIERTMTRNLNKHNRAIKRTNKLASVETKFVDEINDAIIAANPDFKPDFKPVAKPVKKYGKKMVDHMPVLAHREVYVISIRRDMRYNGIRLIDILFRNKCKFLKHLGYKVQAHMKFCDYNANNIESFAFMISVPRKTI